jgi:hypothetical protein
VKNEQYLATDSQQTRRRIGFEQLGCLGSQSSKLIQINCIVFDRLDVTVPCVHAVTCSESCPGRNMYPG